MQRNDLDFWTSGAGGWAWYFQLLQALELAQEVLMDIKSMITGYRFDDQTTMIVSGITYDGKKFTATYRLSKDWQIPGESVDSLKELKLE